MKVRNGFVSNSSSSSFIIMTKKEKLTSDKLMEVFKISENSPILGVIKKLSNDIVNCTDRMTTEEFLDNYAYGDTLDEREENFKEDYPHYYEYYKLAKENNWYIYDGSADDYEYSNIAEMSLEIDNDEIFIEMGRD